MISILVKILDIRSVEPMVMISHATASRLKLRHTEVVTLKYEGLQIVATPVVVKGFIEDDVIGIGDNSANWLGVKDGSMISVLARRPPQSYELMRKKSQGQLGQKPKFAVLLVTSQEESILV